MAVFGITGVSAKPHSRAASEPEKSMHAAEKSMHAADSEMIESDSDELDPQIEFWPAVEHAMWVQVPSRV